MSRARAETSRPARIPRRRPTAFLCAALLVSLPGLLPRAAQASETDQFTLPDAPLEDLGPEIGAEILAVLHAAAAALNQRNDEGTAGRHAADASVLDELSLAKLVYESVGLGIPETTLERDLHSGDFAGRRVRFEPGYLRTVYAWAVSPMPFALSLMMSPTIQLHGVQLGTDKIGHFFQQGYQYLEKVNQARARGAAEEEAVAAAVAFGVMQEQTMFGIALTGVYSNADLAANFAGFMFYRNLVDPVTIGERTLAPLLTRLGGRWEVNPRRDSPDLLEPYLSEHLNEAYNPSNHFFSVGLIRAHVRERCAEWLRRVPDFSEAAYRARLERTRTWFGWDYGWALPEANAATLLECFAPDPVQGAPVANR